MAEVKKPENTTAKATATVKAPVKAAIEKKEAETVKVVEAAPVKAETAEKKAPAKRAAAKKPAAAKKAAADKTKAAAKKTAEKKAPAKRAAKAKTEAKKPAAAKKADGKAIIHLEFAGKTYTHEQLVSIAKDVWTYDLKQTPASFKSVELYVKPEENVAYYVINGNVTGSFGI